MRNQKKAIGSFLSECQGREQTMVIVSEKYTDSVLAIRIFLRKAGLELKTVVFEDDGFLPEDVITPYECFVLDKTDDMVEEKALFYNFLEIPAFWEIRSDGLLGGIYDMGFRKAVVHFSQPSEKRNVQQVEWCAENGWIYKTDYYNKYGLRWAADFMDENGEVESRVLYSYRNQEVIVIQPQNDTVTLLEAGRLQRYFTSYDQFAQYYLEKTVPTDPRILLIQNEQQLEYLMKRSNREKSWKCIMFLEGKLLQEYTAMGGKKGCRFYADPGKYPVNYAKGKALILTASDQIEGIEYLIRELPEMMFYIAANTQVSDKLYNLSVWENVRIYPQVSQQDLTLLWRKCDFYLDINYYREIFDAVNSAHLQNMLILSFEDTMHDAGLVAEECVFHRLDYEGMVKKIKGLLDNTVEIQRMLEIQQNKRNVCWKRMEVLLGLRTERIE